MLISTLTYRTPAQQAVTAVSWWTPSAGRQVLARVCWDPQGPLTPHGAAVAALRAALEALTSTEG